MNPGMWVPAAVAISISYLESERRRKEERERREREERRRREEEEARKRERGW